MRIVYDILEMLRNANAKSKLHSMTQEEIMDMLKKHDKTWAQRTVYDKIKRGLKEGYIAKGLPKGNSNAYYITIDGLEWMKEVEGE